MKRRVKITESQFDRLFEDDTDPMLIFQNLEVGDSIYTKETDGSHSFQVIDDLGNALKLASLDQKSTKTGWNYIVSKVEGIQDDDIKLQLISKKNPDAAPRNHTIKGVLSVKTFDKNNTEKDSVTVGEPPKPKPDPNSPTNATNIATDDIDDEDTRRKTLEDVLRQLKELKEGRYYIFKVEETTSIIFKVNNNDGSNLNVTIVSSTGAEKDKYLALKGDEYTIPLTMENLSISDMGHGWFNMGMIGGGNTNTLSDISNISDFVEYSGEDDNDDQADDQADDQVDIKKPNKNKMLNFLKKNPDIASALHHQPKLFGMFDAGEPVGLAALNNVLNSYEDRTEAGEQFENNRQVKFTIQSHDIQLKVGATNTDRYKRGANMRAITRKNDRGIVMLFIGEGTRNELTIKILDLVDDDTYKVKFILTKIINKVEETDSKYGVIKITDYNNK